MDITAALDVALGLVLMYLVFSLFCTTLNEFIASALRLRANSLADALKELIDDPKLKDAFDKHGLIDTSKIAASDSRTSTTDKDATTAARQSWLQRLWTNADPSYLSSRNVALALVGALDPDKPVIDIEQVKAKIAAIPVGKNIKDVLDNAVLEAGDNIDKLRDSIAAWFDDSMDRLSGAYKRNLQLISLAVGFVIAVAFNADTIHVGTQLWQDRALSASFAQAAPALVQKMCSGAACKNDQQADDTNLTPDSAAQAAVANFQALNTNLHPLPIGWGNGWCPHDFGDVVLKLLGLILTGIALSMGAPFWFDILQNVMNFRSTGDKPAKVGQKP